MLDIKEIEESFKNKQLLMIDNYFDFIEILINNAKNESDKKKKQQYTKLLSSLNLISFLSFFENKFSREKIANIRGEFDDPLMIRIGNLSNSIEKLKDDLNVDNSIVFGERFFSKYKSDVKDFFKILEENIDKDLNKFDFINAYFLMAKEAKNYIQEDYIYYLKKGLSFIDENFDILHLKGYSHANLYSFEKYIKQSKKINEFFYMDWKLKVDQNIYDELKCIQEFLSKSLLEKNYTKNYETKIKEKTGEILSLDKLYKEVKINKKNLDLELRKKILLLIEDLTNNQKIDNYIIKTNIVKKEEDIEFADYNVLIKIPDNHITGKVNEFFFNNKSLFLAEYKNNIKIGFEKITDNILNIKFIDYTKDKNLKKFNNIEFVIEDSLNNFLEDFNKEKERKFNRDKAQKEFDIFLNNLNNIIRESMLRNLISENDIKIKVKAKI